MMPVTDVGGERVIPPQAAPAIHAPTLPPIPWRGLPYRAFRTLSYAENPKLEGVSRISTPGNMVARFMVAQFSGAGTGPISASCPVCDNSFHGAAGDN